MQLESTSTSLERLFDLLDISFKTKSYIFEF